MGQGSGNQAPNGKGAWFGKATRINIQPRRKILTKRTRVARCCQRWHANASEISRSVPSAMVSSAAPPTLSSHQVATATASHKRAARWGSGMRVRCHGPPARWVSWKPGSIQARRPYQQAALTSGGKSVRINQGAVWPSSQPAHRVPRS